MTIERGLFGCIVLFFLVMPASAEGVQLKSREYKVMLRPERFSGQSVESTVSQFWNSDLQRVITASIGLKRNGTTHYEGSLRPLRRRDVRFFDTHNCMLNQNGYALRERVDAGQDDATREITLKLRRPDLIFVAVVDIDGKNNKDKDSKFEEDITPLRVSSKDGTLHGNAVDPRTGTSSIAQQGSMRSSFSRSTEKKLKRDDPLADLGDAFDLFPTLKQALNDTTSTTKLDPGDQYREVVYRGATVDLGDTKAELSLTLWYPEQPARNEPAVAEISFSYDLKNGLADQKVTRNALSLFSGMQGLTEWVDLTLPAKTAAGLRRMCSE